MRRGHPPLEGEGRRSAIARRRGGVNLTKFSYAAGSLDGYAATPPRLPRCASASDPPLPGEGEARIIGRAPIRSERAVVRRPNLQDKSTEIAFFDRHAADDDYDVFTPQASARLVNEFVRLSGLAPPARVIDLGCGSGTFTYLLQRSGYDCVGLDISGKLVEVGRRRHAGLELLQGDIEYVPFADASFDGVLLSGVVHHFPDPSRCAAEVFRILRPQGRFFAFDPNRMNPFMWLYRDPASPFYSSVGVTANERPVLAREVAAVFERAGFDVSSRYLAGLAYRYVASGRARLALPIYNFIDAKLFGLSALERFRPFVLTLGRKRAAPARGAR